jgi:hypothetical protein
MDTNQVEEVAWFQELLRLVQAELDRRQSDGLRDRPNLESELNQVRDQMSGLRLSLSNPQLNPKVRQCLESDLGQLLEQEGNLHDQVQAEHQRPQAARQLVNPTDVLERLERLDEVLRSGNPSEVNVELSYFIDRIACSGDGTVTLRVCPFGVAPSALALMGPLDLNASDSRNSPPEKSEEQVRTIPRRRSIRRVEDRDAAHFVADPNRFRNVPERWFWTESFQQPRRKSWAEAHADQVYAARFAADGTIKATFEKLERVFGRTKPTLRAALKIAREMRLKDGQQPDGHAV